MHGREARTLVDTGQPFARKLATFVNLSQDDLSVLSDVYRRKPILPWDAT